MKCRVRNVKSKLLKKQITESVKFYSQRLMHPNLHRNIHVTVLFDKMKHDEYAECYPTFVQQRPRNFIIRLKKGIKKPFHALAHEMIHVKQYAKGELCLHHTKWKNTHISKNMPYHLLPWEKEAYRKDYPLYREYKKTLRD